MWYDQLIVTRTYCQYIGIIADVLHICFGTLAASNRQARKTSVTGMYMVAYDTPVSSDTDIINKNAVAAQTVRGIAQGGQ